MHFYLEATTIHVQRYMNGWRPRRQNDRNPTNIGYFYIHCRNVSKQKPKFEYSWTIWLMRVRWTDNCLQMLPEIKSQFCHLSAGMCQSGRGLAVVFCFSMALIYIHLAAYYLIRSKSFLFSFFSDSLKERNSNELELQPSRGIDYSKIATSHTIYRRQTRNIQFFFN